MDLSHHPLDALELNQRARNVIYMGKIDTLEKLCAIPASRLIKYRGVGRCTVAHIQYQLQRIGLSLAPEEDCGRHNLETNPMKLGFLEGPLSILFGEAGQPKSEIVCVSCVRSIDIEEGHIPNTALAWDKRQVSMPGEVVEAITALGRIERGETNLMVLGENGIVDKSFGAARWFLQQGMVLRTQALKEKTADERE